MKKRKLYDWLEEEFMRQGEIFDRQQVAFDKKKNPTKAEYEKVHLQGHRVTGFGILVVLCEELSKGIKLNAALEKVAKDILDWRR